MSGFLSSLVPRDHRLTFSLLIAGTGALALFLDYYYRDKHESKRAQLPNVTSKIESGNCKLEEAIRYYESALVDMQAAGADSTERMQVRAMLLRAYEIQAILSPDEFKLRSSVMIEGVPQTVVQDVLQASLPENKNSLLEVDNKNSLPEVENRLQLEPRAGVSSRTDSLSSEDDALLDFYEAYDFLDEEGDENEDQLPEFFKDQLFLHKRGEFKVRKNRFQQFNLSSPTEYLVKVQCLRLALDRMMRSTEKRSWMVNIGRDQTVRLLELAGADTEAFSSAFDRMLAYVAEAGNLASIREELQVRRVACVNVFDIVIDFCLLDSFDDLDMPPASLTSVMSNSWISSGIRKSMLSTAVWGLISSKVKKSKPDGFLSRFYEIMGVLTPSLAWGFLGDDPDLHPICMLIRNDTIDSLTQVFDDSKTDYSSLDNLTEDLYRAMVESSERLKDALDKAQ